MISTIILSLITYFYLLHQLNTSSLKLKEYLISNNLKDIHLVLSESMNKRFNTFSRRIILHQFSKKVDNISIHGVSFQRKSFDATIDFEDTNYMEINMIFENNQWKIDNLFLSSPLALRR